MSSKQKSKSYTFEPPIIISAADQEPASQDVEEAKPLSLNVLDVGCGAIPKGDINVDFFKGGVNKQVGNQKTGVYVNPKNIRNFVVADAQHLPFKKCIFNRVICNHVIEHVANPYLLLTELLRVAKREVVVTCPHRLSRGAKKPFHKHYFNCKWFEASLTNYNVQITASLKGFPNELFGLFMLPDEIRVAIRK